MSDPTQIGVPLVHYPKLSSGPIIDDERWLPANRRPPTHLAIPLDVALALEDVAKAARNHEQWRDDNSLSALMNALDVLVTARGAV